MSSSYLDLYSGAGSLRQRGVLGTSSVYNNTGWGTPQNVYYQPGGVTKVVHDKYNNMYYGQTKQTDVVKGLQDSIKRIQGQLGRKSETSYSTGWMGALNSTTRYYSAEDRKQQNDSIARLNKDLKHVQSGGYKQEGSQFFESYDAYTGDWNNVFNKRKSNADQKEANRLQEIQNEKTRVRNKKIEGQNQIMEQKAREAEEAANKPAQGSQARAKKLTPNLEIGTGISASADKLAKSLGTGISSSLNKTGLGI